MPHPHSAKPVMLLDIDGVVSAIQGLVGNDPAIHVWPTWERRVAEGGGKTWPLLASVDVLTFIGKLVELDQVEIRWHSTWQEEAHNFSDAFDLPRLPIQRCPEWPSDGYTEAARLAEGLPGWWKYLAAERVLTRERRPLIWVDDDLKCELTTVRRDGMGQLGRVLLVCPNRFTGLTPNNLRTIENFIDLWDGVPYGALSGS